ncbi:hypothetical protein GCM10010195_50990 [Kitasatospora griseola]|nr:hypothetical protein GCM10010195_50990 [Kitasatospora griseola]
MFRGLSVAALRRAPGRSPGAGPSGVCPDPVRAVGSIAVSRDWRAGMDFTIGERLRTEPAGSDVL